MGCPRDVAHLRTSIGRAVTGPRRPITASPTAIVFAAVDPTKIGMGAGAKPKWLPLRDTPGTHLSWSRVRRVWDPLTQRSSVGPTPRRRGSLSGFGSARCHAVTFPALVFLLAQMAIVIAPTPAAATSGARWAIAADPESTAGGYDFLTDVACSSVRDCTAVGYYYRASNTQTLIERWNGSKWSVTPSPNTNELLDNYLSGIACVSTRSCTAVGYHYDGHAQQPLIVRWNGVTWSIVRSAALGPSGAFLSAVSCRSRVDCTAVGAARGTTANQPLIEHWNGTAWSVEPTPSPTRTLNSYLTGVSCNSSNLCAAVGRYFTGSVFRALVEVRNGTAWSIVRNPAASTGTNSELDGVSCPSVSDCTAVGSVTSARTTRTLIEHGGGSRWSIVASPNGGVDDDNYLSAVSCPTARACTAVGHYFTGTSFLTLVEQRKGSGWSVVPSPNVNVKKTNYLTGVSCLSSSTCTAVGYFDVATNQPLIVQIGPSRR